MSKRYEQLLEAASLHAVLTMKAFQPQSVVSLLHSNIPTPEMISTQACIWQSVLSQMLEMVSASMRLCYESVQSGKTLFTPVTNSHDLTWSG